MVKQPEGSARAEQREETSYCLTPEESRSEKSLAWREEGIFHSLLSPPQLDSLWFVTRRVLLTRSHDCWQEKREVPLKAREVKSQLRLGPGV